MTVRKALTWLAAVMLVAAGMGRDVIAQDSETREINVAVIDTQAVLKESLARRSIRDQIDKHAAIYKQEISRRENELRKAESKLSRQRTLLSADAFKQRRAALDRRYAELQRYAQGRKRLVNQAVSKAMRQVQSKVFSLAAELSKEKNLAMIFPRAALVYSMPQLDLTKEVLKRLNASLPSVKVDLPEK